MVRVINSATLTEAKTQQIIACNLGKFEFKDETLYFNTSPIDITFDSKTYLAVGDLAEVEAVTETDEVRSTSLTIHLSMLNEDMRKYAADLDYANRPATIYRAYLNSNYDIIGTPLVMFYGAMDNVTFNESAGESVLTMTIADHLIDWARTRNGRYTDAEQKLIDSTDTGLSHIENAIQINRGEVEVEWKSYL